MNWYFKVFKQYADFNGRARREEYWMFFLFNFIAWFLLGIISFFILSIFYSFAVLIPSIAVTVRRLHDIGKSGWMILIVLIPIAGAVWLLVLLCMDSIAEANEYGENPKKIKIESSNDYSAISKICSSCNNAIDSEARFCENCGCEIK